MVTRCKLAESDELVARALEEERAGGGPHSRYSAHYYRAMALAARGRVGEAKAALAAADALATGAEVGLRLQLEFGVAGLVGDHRWTLDQARERSLMATELSRHRALAFAVAGVAAAELGELDDARRYVSRARGMYGDRPWGFQSEWARYGEAVLAWREAGPGAAAPTLREAAARLMAMDAWSFAIPPLVDLAEVGGRLGRPEAARPRTGWRQWRNAATSIATGRCWRWPRPGRPSPAAPPRRGGRRRPGRRGAVGPRLARLSRPGPGAARRHDRRPGPGRRSAAVRRRGLRHHRVAGARTEALGALGRLGSAGKRASAAASGPASLTSREREVAALAAAGLSAKEIGVRLFIGKRTVESHLAGAYAKLGVRSKVELARRGPELGLEPGS